MVCTAFEMILLFISVIMMARITGTGKQITICQRAIMIVFFTVLAKSGPVMYILKFSSPTKRLPSKPRNML